MRIRWSQEAREDVERLADFVAPYDPVRADEIANHGWNARFPRPFGA